ncbi:MAG TPA: metal-sensitive transcriptional regulator [Thermoanaerobaculia bacterium]|nr:metal-sensitive transcriptional regulator [Thermoanaerobaculia bacterium]
MKRKNHTKPEHAAAVDDDLKKDALVRLKRIEGQVRGIQRMVEEQRYCADVLMQISAVHESLRSVAQLMLRNHLQHCATDAIKSSDPARRSKMYDELVELFAKHVR